MQYLGKTPGPPLDAFIARIWYCADAPLHVQERVLPSGGSIDLAVNLADDSIQTFDPQQPRAVRRHPGAVIIGTSTRSYLVDPRQRASVIGVHFRPGGAFPFLGISPSEILDCYVSLADLWGPAGRNLRERLLDTRSPSEQLRLVEKELLQRLEGARAGHPAVRLAVQALRPGGDDAPIAEVAAAAGLSHRRFVEVFEREVGLTPKLYARLQRFHRVKERLALRGEPESWASFALDAGYCDQSHLIREFAGFAGISPASYLRARSEETQFDHAIHTYSEQRAR